jgi:signal transduction histidine kinase
MVHVISFRFLGRISAIGADVLQRIRRPSPPAADRGAASATGVFRTTTEKLSTSATATAALEAPGSFAPDPGAGTGIAVAAPRSSAAPPAPEPAKPSSPPAGPKVLSMDERAAFEAIGAMLGSFVDPELAAHRSALDGCDGGKPRGDGQALPTVTSQVAAILDLVPVGIVVFRDTGRIFTNRFLLDLLDVEDPAAAHTGGRLDTITQRLARPTFGADLLEIEVGGAKIATIASVHTILWEGVAATLACLRPCVERGWKRIEEELEDARRQAERASALKSEFLAKVSHEVRTPLNAILGFAEVILDERFGPIGNARYKDYLEDIQASGQLVMSLVNDLLDLSKIEAGKMDLACIAVDANAIVTECVSIMQPQASRDHVFVQLSLWPELPPVRADARSLRQIVLNLLSNAVKFNEPGGRVVVATLLASGRALVRVEDNGIGMSDPEIEIALLPFGRVGGARPSIGTGLGLPLTKALVEANGACFSITSKKSEGTMVEIAFPVA